MNTQKLIGILGGSGPEAGVQIVSGINHYMQEMHGACQDTDYPDYILYNKPLRGFDETGVTDEHLVQKDFHHAMQQMISMGCTILGVACNTLHLYTRQYHNREGVVFVDMIEAVVNKTKQTGTDKVLVLSSVTTKNSQLYRDALLHAGIHAQSVTDKEQIVIDHIILHMMSNTIDDHTLERFVDIIDTYKQQGYHTVILGCTELPLVLPHLSVTHTVFLKDMNIIESNNCLIEGCIAAYYQ